ncbi:MAG: methyltransferase [Phormidesmis sp.]
MEKQSFLHTTPPEVVRQVVDRRVTIGDRTFTITYPGNTDQLLDHPSTHAAFEADAYMPYWAELWPSAHMLGEALLPETNVQQLSIHPSNLLDGAAPMTALEIGCGVGLPGIVALSLGMRVIFSDYDVTATQFAANNALANGFNNFETLALDWRVPPRFQVPLLLAADVIYEERNIEPLIQLIQTVLTPGGICLLSDPDRSTRKYFRFALKRANLSFSRQPMTAPGPEGRVVQGSVYCILNRP